MFFKNYLITLACKYLWLGLILGIIYILIKLTNKVFNNNVYVYNSTTFVYYLAYGFIYCLMCQTYYDYCFCWFGLIFMIIGSIFIKISLEFFFTKFINLLYNCFVKKKLKES